MAISLQELRKAEQKQQAEQQKKNQQEGAKRFPWQEEPQAKKGVLKFANYLYGN